MSFESMRSSLDTLRSGKIMEESITFDRKLRVTKLRETFCNSVLKHEEIIEIRFEESNYSLAEEKEDEKNTNFHFHSVIK